ncbi:MAG TPA: sugar phosphate nucleotidyltransferase [Streptosporangiaceae bacterium]
MTGRLGIVPAAGAGTRLSPYRAPKELIQVGYRSADGQLLPKAAIEHVLTALAAGGANQAFVVLSPAKWDLFRYLGSGEHLGLDLAYLCQETPLGMPHAIDLATPFLAGQTVGMGMPDTIVAPQDCFAQLFDFHEGTRADLSLGVFPTAEPRALAPVVIEPGSHRVLAIMDKPLDPPAANTWGIAVWSPLFTELLHDYVAAALRQPGRELLLSEVFADAITAGLRVHALAFDGGEFHDIGKPANVRRVRAWLEQDGDANADDVNTREVLAGRQS